jgi:hypothetical protein
VMLESSHIHRGCSPQRRATGDGQLIVERVVEKIGLGGPTNYPILMKTNYNQWALLMRIKLEAHGLWGVVDPGDAEYQVDRIALDAICSAISVEMITTFATKDSTMEAWESIKMMRIGDDRIRKASTQKVRHEYEVLDFHDGGVKGFAMRLTGMVNQLSMLGDPEPNDKVILKFLRIVRPRFKQLVISIETLLDVSTLMLEGVIGRLRSAEEDGVAPPATDGKLYLTEQEWAKQNKKDTDLGLSSRGDRSREGSGRKRGRGRGGRGDEADGSGGKGNCHRCGKPGHWAQDYRSKQPKKDKEEQAFMAQEESTLLYAKVESKVLPATHRSGCSRRISDEGVGHGATDQWSARAGMGITNPAGAHVP